MTAQSLVWSDRLIYPFSPLVGIGYNVYPSGPQKMESYPHDKCNRRLFIHIPSTGDSNRSQGKPAENTVRAPFQLITGSLFLLPSTHSMPRATPGIDVMWGEALTLHTLSPWPQLLTFTYLVYTVACRAMQVPDFRASLLFADIEV